MEELLKVIETEAASSNGETDAFTDTPAPASSAHLEEYKIFQGQLAALLKAQGYATVFIGYHLVVYKDGAG
jgi:hypothetical protein